METLIKTVKTEHVYPQEKKNLLYYYVSLSGRWQLFSQLLDSLQMLVDHWNVFKYPPQFAVCRICACSHWLSMHCDISSTQSVWSCGVVELDIARFPFRLSPYWSICSQLCTRLFEGQRHIIWMNKPQNFYPFQKQLANSVKRVLALCSYFWQRIVQNLQFADFFFPSSKKVQKKQRKRP